MFQELKYLKILYSIIIYNIVIQIKDSDMAILRNSFSNISLENNVS